MSLRHYLLLGSVVLMGCGRTGLYGTALDDSDGGGLGAGTGGTGTGTGAQPSMDPEGPDEEPPEPPIDLALLPEVTVATKLHQSLEATDGIVMVAPLVAERGPFELTRSAVWMRYAPGGARFAYIDEDGLFLVDSWPPVPRGLEVDDVPRQFAWLDQTRLLVATESKLELLNVERGTHEVLYEVTGPTDNPFGYPIIYLPTPSPDKRWVVFAEHVGGGHRIWLFDVETRASKLIRVLEPDAVLAWFDWAPDSEHLIFNVAEDGGVWLKPLSVATKGEIGEVLPFSVPFDETSQIPSFRWSPNGDALHYYYQDLDPTVSQMYVRLYVADMSEPAPGPSVLLNSFDVLSWSSEGHWSPRGDKVAFSAQFGGENYGYAEFVSSMDSLATPVQQHAGRFTSLFQQEWSPDGAALYFIAQKDDYVSRLYRSDLTENAVQVSPEPEHVSGVYPSSVPGCFAYGRYTPTPGMTIVKESTGSRFEVAEPNWSDPDWSASFDNGYVHWVNDASGVRGLLYVTFSSGFGNTVAWVSVTDCVPSEPEILIQGEKNQSIWIDAVSTEPPQEERN